MWSYEPVVNYDRLCPDMLNHEKYNLNCAYIYTINQGIKACANNCFPVIILSLTNEQGFQNKSCHHININVILPFLWILFSVFRLALSITFPLLSDYIHRLCQRFSSHAEDNLGPALPARLIWQFVKKFFEANSKSNSFYTLILASIRSCTPCGQMIPVSWSRCSRRLPKLIKGKFWLILTWHVFPCRSIMHFAYNVSPLQCKFRMTQ